MAAVPQGGCLAPSCQPSVLGNCSLLQGTGQAPSGGRAHARRRPCGHCAPWDPWGTTALYLAEASTALGPIWEMPPVLVPLCQHLLVRCPPTPPPLPSTATGPLPPTQWAASLGFPCWSQQTPQETCSTRQGLLLGSRAAGRAVAQLGLTRTQVSHREYFSVLSLLFKVPFCKGCLRL